MRLDSPKLGGFFHKAGTNTTRANLHSFYRTGFFIHTAQALQVRPPDAFGLVIGVAYVISNRWFFPTNFTYTRHDRYPPKKMSEVLKP